jgi:hypothetical protein
LKVYALHLGTNTRARAHQIHVSPDILIRKILDTKPKGVDDHEMGLPGDKAWIHVPYYADKNRK